MTNRSTFDAKMESIRSKYMKVSSSPPDKVQKTSTICRDQQFLAYDRSSIDKTLNKKNVVCFEDQFESFNLNSQRQDNIMKAKIEDKINLEPSGRNVDETFSELTLKNRGSLTDRQVNLGTKELSSRLSQKQQQLIKRMKENEKLLKQSKQVREGDSKILWQVDKVDKQSERPRTALKERASVNQNETIGQKKLVEYAKEKHGNRGLTAQKRLNYEHVPYKGAQKRGSGTQAMDCLNSKMTHFFDRFNQKHDKDSFDRRVDVPKNNQQVPISSFVSVQTKTVPERVSLKGILDKDSKAEDLKVRNALESASKIQEKIRAVLSYR